MNTMRVAGALAVSVGLLLSVHGAQAIEIDGVWASNETVCAKVFVKRGNKISVAKDSDLYGSGFIVEANRIRGKVATCAIKSRKEDGAVLHLLTTCSTDVALQNVQFSVKSDGKDKLTRIFPGLPELDTAYYRCPMK